MSCSTSIFIATSCSYEEVVSSVEQLLNLTFTKDETVPWPLSIFCGLGLRLALIGELDYEDDQGIAFSQYSYQFGIQVTHRVEESQFWEQFEYAVAMYIYHRIKDVLGWKCVVVEDMQQLLAGN